MVKKVIYSAIIMFIFVKLLESPLALGIGSILGFILILRFIYKLTKKNKREW